MGKCFSRLLLQQQIELGEESSSMWDFFVTFDHQYYVAAIACSKDGKLIALAREYRISIYNAKSGREEGQYPEHPNIITSVAFLQNDEFLISGCLDGIVRIWNIKSKKQLKCPYLESGKMITDVLISQDQRNIAAQSIQYECIIWKISEKQIQSAVRGQIQSFDFAPNSKIILFAIISYKYIFLENILTRKKLQFYHIQQCIYVNCVKFSSDGQIVVIASSNKIQICDLQSTKLRIQVQAQIYDTLSFSPQGDYLLCGSQDGAIRLLNICQRQYAQLNGHQSPIQNVGFSPDGRYIFALDQTQVLRFQKVQ